MSKINATARVQITVEVDGGVPWDYTCSIGQMYKQAAESGLAELKNAFKDGARVKIVGEPKIIGVVTEKE